MVSHIFNNLATKLIVVVLAILVWFFVKTEDNYRYSFKIPLRVTNLGSDRIINNDVPKRIKITSWGKGRELLSLMLRKEMFYNLDVSRVEHSASFALEKGEIKLTHETNIEILNIVDPETVEVKIADLIIKKIPIIMEAEIQTLPGYTVVDEIVLKPDSVEVIGIEANIAKISTIRTQHKIFRNIKRDLQKRIQLEKPANKQVKLLTDEVELTVNIQKLMEKPIYEVPVTVINHPSNLKVTVIPSTLSLILEGGTDLLLNVTKQDVKAYIDYQKVHASKNKNHLAYIETPRGIRYRDVKPKRFKVVVEKIKQTS
jgi:YbbR domain-containing protein